MSNFSSFFARQLELVVDDLVPFEVMLEGTEFRLAQALIDTTDKPEWRQ